MSSNGGENKQTVLKHIDFYIDNDCYIGHFTSAPTPDACRDSCRDMFFTQPPRYAARFYCRKCVNNDSKGWFGVQHDKGLRLGTVVDEIVKHVQARHPNKEHKLLPHEVNTVVWFHGSCLIPPYDCIAMDMLDETLELESTPVRVVPGRICVAS
ncbi:hypothetical protein AC578_2653 [Pseudocercospora eumusae]|uniref:Uncharacterized protein n=1 Tax=Pseudocercospora eumusae TaxID=321146 RepID=A0A139H142_9PEZI|nr:hypothetical protein AC578_2653 [Pseudocercospora eumusae]